MPVRAPFRQFYDFPSCISRAFLISKTRWLSPPQCAHIGATRRVQPENAASAQIGKSLVVRQIQQQFRAAARNFLVDSQRTADWISDICACSILMICAAPNSRRYIDD